MCTAICFEKRYFGRTLDWMHGFDQRVVVTGRDLDFKFRHVKAKDHHPAIMGMAKVVDGYPLYFDGVNEYGLCAAGLNFTRSACYVPREDGVRLCPFEFIPFILSECKSIDEARELLSQISFTDEDFSPTLKNARLHFIVSDGDESITVEPRERGVELYENKVGVLTNEPPFDYHILNLASYMNVTAREAQNRFAPALDISAYSGGLGGVGLPGDTSSPSRFVRAAFAKFNCCEYEDGVTRFFHVLGAVEQTVGQERTQYTSCIDTESGIYYCKTYGCSAVTAVNMRELDLDGKGILQFPLRYRQVILAVPQAQSLSDS